TPAAVGDTARQALLDRYTVTGGEITLEDEYSNVHIGLPIRFAEIETLDLDVQGTALRDAQKRVGSVTLLVEQSARNFSVGPDATHLQRFVPQAWESAADFLSTGQCEVNVTATFERYGRLMIRHSDPTPLTILGVVPRVEVGN
ncbi:MAG TPA: hypothetical protein VK573_12510, partial [Gemmatimonadales bacterium]|nr:hypothetical protein [Gemmatimonadales bacterium]